MMNDAYRNDCYDRAIRKAVTADTRVLDIGSGSGLLAMMAARAGAQQVTTCEKVKPIANMARQIVALNGFTDTVKVVNKISTDLKIGVDLPDKANLLVSEIFDVGLLAEGAVPVIEHARAHLLTPDAQILPRAATVYAVLVESTALYQEDRVQTASGFDVSPFNAFASNHNYLQNYLRNFPHRLLSETFAVFDCDFCGAPILPQKTAITVDITASGTCHAVVFWFRLWLDTEIFIDTSPFTADTCWMQAIQLWRSPLTVMEGQVFRLTACHDRTYITFVTDV
jgi:SAM-dependent methyltransferase